MSDTGYFVVDFDNEEIAAFSPDDTLIFSAHGHASARKFLLDPSTLRFVDQAALRAYVSSLRLPTDTASPETTTTTLEPLEDLTVEELYELATAHAISGRSDMLKSELVEALKAAGVQGVESG